MENSNNMDQELNMMMKTVTKMFTKLDDVDNNLDDTIEHCDRIISKLEKIKDTQHLTQDE